MFASLAALARTACAAARVGNVKAATMSRSSGLRYRRLLLKLSGEALMGDREFGLEIADRVVGRKAEPGKRRNGIGFEMKAARSAGPREVETRRCFANSPLRLSWKIHCT